MFEGTVLRVLSDPPLSGFENMSRDEVLWENLRERATPVLRFFRWKEKTLSIGRFQKTHDINREYLKKQGIPLVRRPTGGRAILHGEEVTLSFVFPGLVDGSPRHAYQIFQAILREALRDLGVQVDEEMTHDVMYLASPACFALTFPHELAVRGKKIAGIAQARNRWGHLFQVSLPLSLDREEFASCFRQKEMVFRELEEHSVTLTELGFGFKREEIEEAVAQSFRKLWNVTVYEDRWSAEEEERNRFFLQQKYLLSSYHWGMLKA